MSPIISIIVPSFNEEKNIGTCLDSILNQTFEDFEVLCVDDNSQDSTYDIIVEYSKKDSRIIPLKNSGKGVSSARNTGLEKSSGKYIGFVDSDDFIHPQMYEFLYKSIKDNNCTLSLCNISHDNGFEKENFEFKSQVSELRDILCENNKFTVKNELLFSSVCTKLIDKNLFDDIKFKNYKIGEDSLFCSELFLKIKNFSFVDLPLYCQYQNPESVTRKIENYEFLYKLFPVRFLSFDVFNNYYDSTVPAFFIDRGMKEILTLKFEVRNLENKKEYISKSKKYFRKYLIKFFMCKNIEFKEKISIILFNIFPGLYIFYRKKLDKTL